MTAIMMFGLLLTPTSAQVPGGAQVYEKSLPAVVWIQSARKSGSASGSGSLVDAGRKLVLTNYHVVEDNPRAMVYFPAFRDGQAIPEKSYYKDRAARLGVAARVIATNRETDLAVLEIERIPQGLKALSLADRSPVPGEVVHSIGNAGRSGALWGYVRGTVRQVYQKKWQAELGSGRKQLFSGRVIETDSPTNAGDSGGPLLNEGGQLVGVTQGGAVNAQSVSFFIDITEVRKILESREVLALKPRDGPKPVVKPVAITLQDGAKIFSADAVKKANSLLAEFAKAGRPVRIETIAETPETLQEKLLGVTAAERRELFERYAFGRLQETKTDGAILFVCMKPATAVVVMTNTASRRYPEGTTKRIAKILLDSLKKKDYDAALMEPLTALQDAKAVDD